MTILTIFDLLLLEYSLRQTKMRGKGFEPLKALSHGFLRPTRLTAPASPREKETTIVFLKISWTKYKINTLV